MHIIVKEGDIIIAEPSFEDEAVYAGSQPGCAVHLADPQIASHHLLISPNEDGSWSVEPLSPEPPTMMNGQPIREATALPAKAEIAILHYTLTIDVAARGPARAAKDARLSPADLAQIKKYPLPPGSLVKKPGDPAQLSPGQIAMVARAGLEIAGTRDLGQVVDVTLTHLIQGFRGRCAWMGIRRQTKGEPEIIGGRYASGEPSDAPALAKHLVYRCLERSQHILIRRPNDPVIGSALGVPLVTSLGNLGMLYVDARRGAKRLGTTDLDALQVVAAHVAHQVEALLRGQVRQSAQIGASELAILRGMQELMDPVAAPSAREYPTSVFSMAGQADSGDVYDMMKVPGKEQSGVLVASATAEGALRPLLMAQTHAIFRMMTTHGNGPHIFLRQLNYLLYGSGASRYVSAFALTLDPATGTVTHCRAGRIGAVIINSKGQPRPFGTIEMPAVGVKKAFEYNASEDTLAPGETIVLYTRGVTTAMNRAGQRFRERAFLDCLCDAFGQAASAMLDDLKTDLGVFLDGGSHPDDMTVMLLQRRSG